MRTLNHANLWDYWNQGRDYVVCITTNGSIKRNGEGVMGRGCAKEAAIRFPKLPKTLGELVKANGNIVQELIHLPKLVAFPVKHEWWQEADLELIAKSARELVVLSELENFKNRFVFLPRPGCGNGKLKWEDVQPVIEPILVSDNFYVVTRQWP